MIDRKRQVSRKAVINMSLFMVDIGSQISLMLLSTQIIVSTLTCC